MALIAFGAGAFLFSSNNKDTSSNNVSITSGVKTPTKKVEVKEVMSKAAISIKERVESGETTATFEKTEREEIIEETKSKFDNSTMRTFVKIPYKRAILDPIWITKKFKG